MSTHRPGKAHPAASDFLGHERETRRRYLRTAEFLGHKQSEEADILHLRDQIGGVVVPMLKITNDRLDAVFHPFPDDPHDLLLFAGEIRHTQRWASPPTRRRHETAIRAD